MSPTRPAPSVADAAAYVPREHGATAMLLTPFLSAAILLRQASWQEAAALIAAVCALVIKNPLVVIARQRFVWKNEHPETRPAIRAAAIESILLVACGAALLLTRDWRPFAVLIGGATLFTALAIFVTVRNKQRAEWFQVASAVALTSSAITACLAVRNQVPQWAWWLWFLSALQATAGIFVVHARLDARIAARKKEIPPNGARRATQFCIIALLLTACYFSAISNWPITAALAIAAAGYQFDLKRQSRPDQLNLPLSSVGRQALTLAIVYAVLLIAGLWNA